MAAKSSPRPGASAEVPPQNIEAERRLLGSLLAAPERSWAKVHRAGLRSGDFYLEKHGVLYTVIADLATRGKPTDEISVNDALTARGEIDAAGGEHYVSELATTAVPGSADHHANIIRAHAVQRDKAKIGDELRNGLGPVEAIERLRKIERRRAEGEADASFAYST